MKLHLIIILFSLTLVSASAQERLKIRKVSFKGNKSLSASKLEDELNMKTAGAIGERFFKKEADLFTMELYKQDLEHIRYIYQKEGFLNVSFNEPTIKVTKNNKVKIRINLNENEPTKISSIKYTVDSVLLYQESIDRKTQRRIRLQSELKENRRFRDEWFYNDQAFINEEFNNLGYAYAQVRHQLTVDTVAHTAELNWIINRGEISYFGPISIQGNERIHPKRIERQLRFKTGDRWSKFEIDESQKQIYNLGIFRVASIKTLLTEEKKDSLPTLVALKEAPRWITRFGAGYGREDKFRAYTDIQYLSFITNTGRVKLYAKHSGLEPYNLQLSFTQPAVFFPFNSITVNPYVIKQHEPAYHIVRNGVNLTFLQHFSERFNSSINLYMEGVDVDSTQTVPKIHPFDYYEDETNYSKSGISLGFVYNNADPRLDPVTGFSIALNSKKNGNFFNESVPFWRNLIEYKKYQGIKPGVTLALKGKVGLAEMQGEGTLIPVEERFYAGGSYSVRGWGRSQLGPKDENGQPTGGNSLLEFSIESRFSVGSRMVLAAFCDAGNVWQSSYHYPLGDLHYAAGFSVRFKTAIGPVGLDFARPIFDSVTRWQFHFNIGNPF